MRFNCGLTPREKEMKRRERRRAEYERRTSWHTWFAWRPVRLDDTNECVWLEIIMIRAVDSQSEYSYDGWSQFELNRRTNRYETKALR